MRVRSTDALYVRAAELELRQEPGCQSLAMDAPCKGRYAGSNPVPGTFI